MYISERQLSPSLPVGRQGMPPPPVVCAPRTLPVAGQTSSSILLGYGHPETAGKTFFDRRRKSKAEQTAFASLLPNKTSLANLVKGFAERFCENQESSAWYLDTKLFLMKAPVEVVREKGEVFVKLQN